MSVQYLRPPPTTPEVVYTSHYCEENIYLLLQALAKNSSVIEIWDLNAVFISNHGKSVALWNQKLAPEDDIMPVVWDYHVVALLLPRKDPARTSTGEVQEQHSEVTVQAWIYDFDSRIPTPVLLEEYLSGTFNEGVPEQFQSLFRIVPVRDLSDHFASDRSHMLSSEVPQDQVYVKPPPAHAPIRGPKAQHSTNLMEGFVNMRASEGFGRMVSLGELWEMC
ncbi:uncharacterized protein SCHCODRAFT_01270368 [Schizophyllum commune H4-8]|uniref:uncharacterized protein n=1 Tax=Schizophyllum commune (strain H4-8 / FGSC 9210) TaxID=578458 RepID=UPI00215EC65A|nr:uncharacterized protein SCHCODRAFT_01270368 [Schizophyllum commune H4-8]KAI5899877.1 hypothetical protein SCHCODRAFT_01270368 [Schizophyllum commune H4-8]